MSLADYFYTKYINYSYESNVNLARSSYNTLCSLVGSSEAMQLLTIIAGANGGVSERKYRGLIDITNDRASYAMVASLAKDMHTPYMVKRVCSMFSRSQEMQTAAINFVYFFASFSGQFTFEDDEMVDYILGNK